MEEGGISDEKISVIEPNINLTDVARNLECIREEEVIIEAQDDRIENSRQGLEQACLKMQAKKTPIQHANELHQKFHLSKQQLKEYTGISETKADAMIKKCKVCQAVPYTNSHIRAKIGFTRAKGAMIKCYADCFEINLGKGKVNFLLMVDSMSEFVFVEKLKNLSTDEILAKMYQAFKITGFPTKLVTLHGFKRSKIVK